jgi:hypothetical protein
MVKSLLLILMRINQKELWIKMKKIRKNLFLFLLRKSSKTNLNLEIKLMLVKVFIKYNVLKR